MEKLLHWSIANAQGDKKAIDKAGQPDPKLLQQLFGGGPDEPTLMKQAITVITNPEAELENKLIAFDNFEMLIENLDNANNIENLKLWQPLIDLLDSPDVELRSSSLSVIGTAVQNNAKSQDNFIKYDGAIVKVMSLARAREQADAVKSKAFYALSSLVRHNEKTYAIFEKEGGLNLISTCLKDSSLTEKLKLRVMSLLAAVMVTIDITDGVVNKLRGDGILEATFGFLKPNCNLYLVDRVLNFITMLLEAKVQLTDAEVVELKQSLEDLESVQDQLNEDDYLSVKNAL